MVTELELCPHCQDNFLRLEDGVPSCITCGWYYNPAIPGVEDEVEEIGRVRKGGMYR